MFDVLVPALNELVAFGGQLPLLRAKPEEREGERRNVFLEATPLSGSPRSFLAGRESQMLAVFRPKGCAALVALPSPSASGFAGGR
jgi:hypothetical protein